MAEKYEHLMTFCGMEHKLQHMKQIIHNLPAPVAVETLTILNGIASHCAPRLEKLQALEQHGVDNWEGYDDAMGELDDDSDDESVEDIYGPRDDSTG